MDPIVAQLVGKAMEFCGLIIVVGCVTFVAMSRVKARRQGELGGAMSRGVSTRSRCS